MDKNFEHQLKLIRHMVKAGENSAHPEIEKKFLERCMAMVSSCPGPEKAPGMERDIRDLCKIYFEYNTMRMQKLGGGEGGSGYHKNDISRATKLKTMARAAQASLQQAVPEFLGCETVIQVYLNMLEGVLNNLDSQPNKNATWDEELSGRVALMKRRKVIFTTYLNELNAVIPCAKKLDALFSTFEKSVQLVLKRDATQELMKEFSDKLRESVAEMPESDGGFKNAVTFVRRSLKKGKSEDKAKNELLLEIARMVAEYVKSNSARLKGPGKKVYLQLWEIKIASEAIEKERDYAANFLAENEATEVFGRLSALKQLRERLHEIATFEAMMSLLETVLNNFFFPIKTMAECDQLETRILPSADQITRNLPDRIKMCREKAPEMLRGPDPEAIPLDAVFKGLEHIIPIPQS